MLKDIFRGWVDLMYPRICILCRRHLPETHGKNPLCQECQESLPSNRPPFCCKCSRPLKYFEETLCDYCQKTSLHFDQAWAATTYDETMRHLIHLFKYGNKTVLKHAFNDLMTAFIRLYHIPVEQFDFILPTPLHGARLRERGYNQSQILAETIAREFGLPLDTRNLRRIRHTENQAHLGPKERWTNIDGAFKIERSPFIKNRNILIIDDLLTTGATASEIARLLKKAGALNVSLLTLSITV